MKKILVTGVNSYIGNSFRTYIQQFPGEYQAEGISVRNDVWKDLDFSVYDCIFDVAGIAHADVGQVTEEQKAQYYKINRDLTIALAEKAKREGVKQFIFISSSIVYGDSAPIGKNKVITKDTPVSPANFYGDSKVQAENGILPLVDENFKVVIVRSPMIYGKSNKGNFQRLENIALKFPIFPYVKNERSMIYFGNLVEFIRLVIKNEESGIFWPQNAEYSNTSELVKMLGEAHGKKIYLISGFAWTLKIASHMTRFVNRAFGSLCYEFGMSEYKENYRKYSLNDSIKLTES